MGSLKSFFLKKPKVIGLFAFIIGYVGINSIPIYNDVLLRVLLSAIMIVIMFFFGGKKAVGFNFNNFKDSAKKGYYPILVDYVF